MPLTTYSCHRAKVAVLVVVLLAIAFAWPQIVLNGQVTIATHVPHVLGRDCNIMRHLPPLYSLAYHGVMYALFVVCFLAYGVLYGRIFYVLWRKGWFESSPSSGNRRCKQGVAPSPVPSLAQPPPRHCEDIKRCRVRISHSNSAGSVLGIKRCSEQKVEHNNSKDNKFAESADKNSVDLDTDLVNKVYHHSSICIRIIHPSGGSSQVDRDLVLVGEAATMDPSSGFHETEPSTDDSLQERSSCFEADCPMTPNSSSVHETNENSLGKLCSENMTADRSIPDGPSCLQFVQNGPLGDNATTENVCSCAPPANRKEKHPRAIHRCQRVQHTAKPGIGRSQSEPCCCDTDTRATRPFLRHCCTCDDITENWNGDGIRQEEKFYSAAPLQSSENERRGTSVSEFKASLRGNAGKECSSFHETEDRGVSPSDGKRPKQRAAFQNLTFAHRVAMFDSCGGSDNIALEKGCLAFIPERPKTDRIGGCEADTPCTQIGALLAVSAPGQVYSCSCRRDLSHAHGPQHVHCRDRSRVCSSSESDLFRYGHTNGAEKIAHCGVCEHFTDAPQHESLANVTRSRCDQPGVVSTTATTTRRPTVCDLTISRDCLNGLAPSESGDGVRVVSPPSHDEAFHVSKTRRGGPRNRSKLSGVGEDFTQDGTKLSDAGEDFTQDRTKLSDREDITQDRTKLSDVREDFTQDRTKLSDVREDRTKDIFKLSNVREDITQDRTKLSDVREDFTQDRTKLSDVREDRTKDISKLSNIREDITQDRTKLSDVREDFTQDRTKLSDVREDRTNAKDSPEVANLSHKYNALDATRSGSPDTIQSSEQGTTEMIHCVSMGITISHEHDTTATDTARKVSPDRTESCENSTTTDVALNASLYLTKSCEGSSLAVTEASPKGSSRKSSLQVATTAAAAADQPTDTHCHAAHMRRHGGKRLRMGKTTLMMAMVTLSTVLGFVPFLTVIVMKTSGARFRDDTASTGDLVYMFCIRSYLINNIVNPFVYFYVNPRFRRKVNRVLRCVCRLYRRWKHHGGSTQSDASTPRSDT